jgi:hypothetical protein
MQIFLSKIRRNLYIQKPIFKNGPKGPFTLHPVRAYRGFVQENQPLQHDLDGDAVWRIAIGLDLGSRSVFEAELLLRRICSAKSLPSDAIDRVLNENWEGYG